MRLLAYDERTPVLSLEAYRERNQRGINA